MITPCRASERMTSKAATWCDKHPRNLLTYIEAASLEEILNGREGFSPEVPIAEPAPHSGGFFRISADGSDEKINID